MNRGFFDPESSEILWVWIGQFAVVIFLLVGAVCLYELYFRGGVKPSKGVIVWPFIYGFDRKV